MVELSVLGWGMLPATSSASGPITTYVYDPVGNRLVLNADGERTTSTYNAANRLINAQDIYGITTYTFDSNGNQRTVETPDNEVTTYSWNFESQLVQIEEPDDVVTTQVYAPVTRNSDELRVSRETDAGTTNFIWDNQNIIEEVDDTSTIEAEYSYNPQAYGNLISQRREDESTFYNYDALGSTESLTDEGATKTNEYTYTAFGQITGQTGSTENSYTWIGELGYYQNPDGSYTLRRRDYTPKENRFRSEDPIGFEGLSRNLYAYLQNSPVNGSDPSGFDLIEVEYPFGFGASVNWVIQKPGWISSITLGRIRIGRIVGNVGFPEKGDLRNVELDEEYGGCIVPLAEIRSLIEAPHSSIDQAGDQARERIVKDRLRNQVCGTRLPPLGPDPLELDIGGPLQTGCKAVTNGLPTAIVRTASLGFCSREIELLAVSEEDRAAGYDTAVAVAGASGEVLIAVVSGGIAAGLSNGGRIAQVAGQGLVIFDAAGNVVGAVRGTIDAHSNGLTWQNGMQIVGSGLGLAGNSATLRGNKLGLNDPGGTCPAAPKPCPVDGQAQTSPNTSTQNPIHRLEGGASPTGPKSSPDSATSSLLIFSSAA